MAPSVAASGLNNEEQALYEELLRETGAPTTSTLNEPAKNIGIAGATQTPAGQRIIPPINPAPERAQERKRSEPEPG